ncbi:DUF5421 family protein [Chlamydia avium]|uniref:Outer protein E n=1 Tax=Chlamydia avium TaxID=1457141 RepID=A0ABN0MTC6_9CHLA|nr:DUF5421 family protein [Chlamydia avium]EPP36262.1 putative outer protein E [Chlamydia psittaci 10_743_SC13]EPP38755.1 putative outer protein E [Chlamydia avium]
MELNKTESLYSCKTESHLPQHDGPAPQDNREVKVFSLEGRQQSRHGRQENSNKGKVASRQETRGTEDKSIEDTVCTKEDSEKEEKFFAWDNPTAGMALVDIAAPLAGEMVVENTAVTMASADLTWIQEVIANTVESMVVAELNGEQLVELVLDSQGNVPEVFSGANLTLVQSGADLSIKLSNFMDNAQVEEAVSVINGNPEQLVNLVTSLKGHQLNLKEFMVGSNVVQLPTIEEVQTPLHMIAASIHRKDEQHHDRQDQQQKQEQEQNQYIEEAQL